MSLICGKKDLPVAISKNRDTHFETFQHELGNVLKNFYGCLEPFNFPKNQFENLSLIPAIDIVDDKDQVKVEVEMPGMGEEDIRVSIDNGVLVIKGEKTTSKQDENGQYRMREINYGSYERSVLLPESVDIDRATASFKKGMLWVTFPKKPECTKKCRTLSVRKIN